MKDRNQKEINTNDRNIKAKLKSKEISTPKKVIIYGPSCSNSTGLGKIIFMMAKSLQEAGHQVFTIAQWYNSHQTWYKDVPILPDFYCETCGSANIGSQEYVQKLGDTISMIRPDYFITVGDPYQFQQYGLGMIDFKNIKVLCYTTMDSEGYFCNELVKEMGKPDFLDNCDRIISMAEYTKEQLKEWKQINSDVIYPPILTELYKPVSSEVKKELRKKYRVDENEFLIYISGRNILRKRHNIAIEACCELLNETDNVTVFLNIPPSKSGNQLYYPDGLNPVDFVARVMKQKYGRDFMTEGKLLFIEREELGSTKINEEQNVEFYQIADLYVSATSGEGFSFCPAESMSCEVPIVIPDNSTGDEQINCLEADSNSPFIIGQEGLLVDTPIHLHTDFGTMQHLCNSEDMYQAIKWMYNNPKDRIEMGKKGRQHVINNFNLNQFKENWVKIIKSTEKKVKPKQEFNKLEFENETKEE